jgi:hypothetical protein
VFGIKLSDYAFGSHSLLKQTAAAVRIASGNFEPANPTYKLESEILLFRSKRKADSGQ